MTNHSMMRLARLLVLAALAGLLVVGRPVEADDTDDTVGFVDQSPAGANDWTCRPSAAHPNPVVLVHGLGANMAANWSYLSPQLAAAGYCVFALTYGVDEALPFPFNQFGGIRPIEESAAELGAFIERVLTATGAERVDIVGHSEGSLMPNYYVKFLGGAAFVERYVALTPLWRGTQFFGLASLYQLGEPSGFSQSFSDLFLGYCGSCPQFLAGSEFIAAMNEGGAAVPGVTYTTVMTRYDLLVTPYTSGYLDAPNATNYVLQEVCALDLSDHTLVAFDPVTLRLTLNALDPATAQAPTCPLGPPRLGLG